MDDDEEQQTVGPQARVPAAAAAANKPERGGKRAREETEAEKDTWLPNFGGTFHIGSRREFKETFRHEV